MTGDPSSPSVGRRYKIQAVTASVNYADFLECIAPNIRHFDRWVIVTSAEDTATHEVCRRWGLEILISKRLFADGAAFHKAAGLNEGLEALDQDAWAIVLDSDILLPADFRERLELQTLDPTCLYGVNGRRICPTIREFRRFAAAEPWNEGLVFTSFVIGYFNLFHLGQDINRYPEHGSDDASTYDVLFSDAFPVTRKRYLPMVCLHAGAASVNWRGRTTDPFFDEGEAPEWDGSSHAEALAERIGGPERRVALLGYYEPAFTSMLAARFGSVLPVDHWGLDSLPPTESQRIDLDWLRARHDHGTASLTNIEPAIPHADSAIRAIPDASLDVLWLAFETDYDSLLHTLPRWLPKLKPGGHVCGGFYSPENVPGPAQSLNLLLGPPDVVYPDMHWARRLPDPVQDLHRLLPPPPGARSDGAGIIFTAAREDDVEPLMVAIHSLRRHWDGPVSVLNAGDEIASLRIACARLGVDFRNVPERHEGTEPAFKRLEAMRWSPYHKTLCCSHTMFFHASPAPLLDALDSAKVALVARPEGSAKPISTGAIAWRADSPLIDHWISLSLRLYGFAGPDALAEGLRGISMLPDAVVLPASLLWEGPVRRMPPGTAMLRMSRLARAGASHLYAPWAEAEQELLARIASQPVPVS